MFDTLDLRLSLIRAYNDLNADRITPNKARAISQIARAITDTVRLEAQAARDGVSFTQPVVLVPKSVHYIEDGSDDDKSSSGS